LEFLKYPTKLEKADISQFGPDKRQLNVLGHLSVTLPYQERSCNQKNYAIKDLKNNLVGLPAIKELEKLSRVCSVEKSIVSQYPALFIGPGKFSQEYKIKTETRTPTIHS